MPLFWRVLMPCLAIYAALSPVLTVPSTTTFPFEFEVTAMDTWSSIWDLTGDGQCRMSPSIRPYDNDLYDLSSMWTTTAEANDCHAGRYVHFTSTESP